MACKALTPATQGQCYQCYLAAQAQGTWARGGISAITGVMSASASLEFRALHKRRTLKLCDNVQSGRYRADDRPSNSVDADSAASGSASQAQHRGYTFGRLLNRPTMPLQLSRQKTESDEAETPTSAWHPPGKADSDTYAVPD